MNPTVDPEKGSSYLPVSDTRYATEATLYIGCPMLWVAPSEKDTATDALEKHLWHAADQLRANSGPTKRFAKSRTNNIDREQLKAAIRAQLDKLVPLNRTRADYLSKFEELIES